MKYSNVGARSRRRSVATLVAGLGAAAALTVAPVAGGVAQASQVKLTTFPTATTTVVTNGTWTSQQGTTGKVLVECPYSTYTKTITGATWIWATLRQAACTSTHGGPGTVTAGTVTLTTTFTVPGSPTSATLALAADNGATVSVNGTKVATLPASAIETNFDHPHTVTFAAGDITSSGIVSGTNTITIVGTNVPYPGYNPAAVVAKLTVTSTLTSISGCKHTGWTRWTTQAGKKFSNQGDCVSYLVGNGNDPTIPTP